jgi:uncharacterized protein (DUF1697 family)
MTAYAGLLRGVNVGGVKLAMADLRAAAEACGYTDVRTYVQSGNVVFRTGGAAAKVARDLRAAIASASGVDVALAVRTAAQLDRVIADCPFDDTAHVHVTFLVEGATAPTPSIDEEAFAPERYAVDGRQVYLYLPNGMGRSKLAVALSRGKAGAAGTTRNWRTVTALRDMAKGS